MTWYYLYLDDLYNWMTAIETLPTPTPPTSPIYQRIKITDSFIDELKVKLKERNRFK